VCDRLPSTLEVLCVLLKTPASPLLLLDVKTCVSGRVVAAIVVVVVVADVVVVVVVACDGV